MGGLQPLYPLLQDPNTTQVDANAKEVFWQMLRHEWRARVVLWLLLLSFVMSMCVLSYSVHLRRSIPFVVLCNLSSFVVVAYYREYEQSRVTQRFLGLVNGALSPCFLQFRGSDLRGLTAANLLD